MMAGFTWIFSLLCAAGCHLASSSPVLRSALVVQTGYNVSLTCNLTSSTVVTWYQLRSNRLLPLLTVSPSKVGGGATEDAHTENGQRFSSSVEPESGLVVMEILEVEEEDAGWYFCAGWSEGQVFVNSGTELRVNGADGGAAGLGDPCWGVWVCVLLSFLSICLAFLIGFYLCSGKVAVCCCPSGKWNPGLKVTQKESLHYSSVKHPYRPRPSARGRARLVEELVTYSTVMNRSHDCR